MNEVSKAEMGETKSFQGHTAGQNEARIGTHTALAPVCAYNPKPYLNSHSL